MPDQRKSLSEQQREALQLARRVLGQQPPSALTLGMAIQDILDAFAAELEDGDDEEPVPHSFPEAYHAPWQPGDCLTCHGHTTHDGVFHAAGAA